MNKEEIALVGWVSLFITGLFAGIVLTDVWNFDLLNKQTIDVEPFFYDFPEEPEPVFEGYWECVQEEIVDWDYYELNEKDFNVLTWTAETECINEIVEDYNVVRFPCEGGDWSKCTHQKFSSTCVLYKTPVKECVKEIWVRDLQERTQK